MASVNFQGQNLYDQFKVSDNFYDVPDFVVKTREYKPFEALMAGAYTGFKGSFVNSVLEKVEREATDIYAKIKNEEMYSPKQAEELFGFRFNKPVSAKYLHGFLETVKGVKNAEELQSRYVEQGGSGIVPIVGSIAGITADVLPFFMVGLPASKLLAHKTGKAMINLGLAKDLPTVLRNTTAITEGILGAGMVKTLEERDVTLGLKDEVNKANVLGAGILSSVLGGWIGSGLGKKYTEKASGIRAKKPVPGEDLQKSFDFEKAAKKMADDKQALDMRTDEALESYYGKKVKERIDKALEEGTQKAFDELEKDLPFFLRDEKGFVDFLGFKGAPKGMVKGKRAHLTRGEKMKDILDVVDPEKLINLLEVSKMSSRELFFHVRQRVKEKFVVDRRYELLKKEFLNMDDVRDKEWLFEAFISDESRRLKIQKGYLYASWQRKKIASRIEKQLRKRMAKTYESNKAYWNSVYYTNRAKPTRADDIFEDVQEVKNVTQEQLDDFYRRRKERAERKEQRDNYISFAEKVGEEAGLFALRDAFTQTFTRQEEIQESLKEWRKAKSEEEKVKQEKQQENLTKDDINIIDKNLKQIREKIKALEETFGAENLEDSKVIGATMHLMPLLFSNFSIKTAMNLLVKGLDMGHNTFIPLDVADIEIGEGVFEALDRMSIVNTLKDNVEIAQEIKERVEALGELPDTSLGMMTGDMVEFMLKPEFQKLKRSVEGYLGKKFDFQSFDGLNEFLTDVEILRDYDSKDMLVPLLLGPEGLTPFLEYNQDMIFDYPFEGLEDRLEQAQKKGINIADLTQKEREELFGMAIDDLNNHVIRSEISNEFAGFDSYIEQTLKHEPAFSKLIKDIEDTVDKNPPVKVWDVVETLKDWLVKPTASVVDNFPATPDENVIKKFQKNFDVENIYYVDDTEKEKLTEHLKKMSAKDREDLFWGQHGVKVSGALAKELSGLSFENFYLINDLVTGKSTRSEREKATRDAINKSVDLDVDAINYSAAYKWTGRKAAAEKYFKEALDAGIVVFQAGGNTIHQVRKGFSTAEYDNHVVIHGLNFIFEIQYKDHLEPARKKTEDEMFQRSTIGGVASTVPFIGRYGRSRARGTSLTSPHAMASYLNYLKGAVTGSETLGPYLKRLFFNYGKKERLSDNYKKEVRLAALHDWIYKIKTYDKKHFEINWQYTQEHRSKIPELFKKKDYDFGIPPAMRVDRIPYEHIWD